MTTGYVDVQILFPGRHRSVCRVCGREIPNSAIGTSGIHDTAGIRCPGSGWPVVPMWASPVLAAACPLCGAGPGEPCWTANGQPVDTNAHNARRWPIHDRIRLAHHRKLGDWLAEYGHIFAEPS